MTVSSRKDAWNLADSIFPTDYVYNSIASKNAGYSIYTSTASNVIAWISDLNSTLELNLPDNKTVRINIVEPVMWDYDGQY